MWSLAAPAALLLLPLPIVTRRLLSPAPAATDALIVPPTVAARLARGAPSRLSGEARRILPALLWIALVLALAGPQRLATTAALPASGRDIVLVLDLSGSMSIEDFELDGAPAQRLDAVKRVAARFARNREGDRLGLVIFGEDAYFATPMTYDTEAVARAIEEATIGISGRSTAISDGLGLALKRLRDSPATSRIVVLLSDGRDTSGTVEPVGAAGLAEQLGIRVHSIAMGVTAIEIGRAHV
nr:VWA domain-containing protein [uncultured Amaricoccus sp.]